MRLLQELMIMPTPLRATHRCPPPSSFTQMEGMLAVKDAELASKDAELAARDRALADKDAQVEARLKQVRVGWGWLGVVGRWSGVGRGGACACHGRGLHRPKAWLKGVENALTLRLQLIRARTHLSNTTHTPAPTCTHPPPKG